MSKFAYTFESNVLTYEFTKICFVAPNSMAFEMMNVIDRRNASDWDPENGYHDFSDVDSYPIHVYSARDKGSLRFNIRSDDADIEYVCRTLTAGFKVFIHPPGIVLKATDPFVRVSFSEAVDISIKPKLITTSNELRKYTPEQRQCFFPSERQLRFFKFYSQDNCLAECTANYTQLLCGCVKFSMPSQFTSNLDL